MSGGIAAWLPTIVLACAAFVFNTSEFLPVGLLPDIAVSVGENVSHTGLMITIYAFVVAVMSLPLTLATAKFERKRLLMVLIAVFAVSHIAVLLSETFESLVALRIAVALTHSVFWAIMTPLAARMAPHGKRAVGLACVMAGTIVATVLGVPLGTQLGHMVGWQNTFCLVGIVALLVCLGVAKLLPDIPSKGAGSIASLPIILKRPALLLLYALVVVTILGQFTAYSFISPILEQNGGYSPEDIVTVLFVFGGSGIIGTVISSKMVDRHPAATMTCAMIGIAASLFLLIPLCASYGSVLALTVLWGAAMTAVGMSFSTVLLMVASDAADVATSIYSGIFNVGIGGGAFVGSLVSREFGFAGLPSIAAMMVCASLLMIAIVKMKTGWAFFGDIRKQHGNEVPLD